MSRERRSATLHELRAFVAAADLGTIGRAAERLGLTQPSLSKRLQSLEELSGVPLLHRSATGVEPTTAGARLLPDARRIVAQADAIDELLGRLDTGEAPLRVASSPAYAELVVPAAIASFRPGEQPRPIELTVANSPHVRAAVHAGRAQVGVAAADLDEDLAAEGHLPLLDDEVVAVMPAGDPWTEEEAVPAAELARRPVIVREPGSHIRSLIDRALASAGLALAPPVLETGSPAAVKSAIRARGVPGLLSRWAVDEQRDGLVVRPIAGVALRRRCWAFLGADQTGPARLFAIHLQQAAAGPDGLSLGPL